MLIFIPIIKIIICFHLKKKIYLKLINKGCINILKSNSNGDFIVAVNGKDNRIVRWFSDYDIKVGISIIKYIKIKEIYLIILIIFLYIH